MDPNSLNASKKKLIHAGLDGELSVEKILEVEAMIEESDLAQKEASEIKALNQKVKEAIESQELPDGFQKRLRANLTQYARGSGSSLNVQANRSRAPYFSWPWAASAAVFVLALYLFGTLKEVPPGSQVLAYADNFHGGLVKAQGVPEVSTHDMSGTILKLNHHMQADFKENSLVIPSARYMGWCNCRVEGIQDIRRLAYLIEGVPLSLYIVRHNADLPCDLLKPHRTGKRLFLVGKSNQFNVVKFQQGSFSYLLVSEMPQDRLVEVSDSIEF